MHAALVGVHLDEHCGAAHPSSAARAGGGEHASARCDARCSSSSMACLISMELRASRRSSKSCSCSSFTCAPATRHSQNSGRRRPARPGSSALGCRFAPAWRLWERRARTGGALPTLAKRPRASSSASATTPAAPATAARVAMYFPCLDVPTAGERAPGRVRRAAAGSAARRSCERAFVCPQRAAPAGTRNAGPVFRVPVVRIIRETEATAWFDRAASMATREQMAEEKARKKRKSTPHSSEPANSIVAGFCACRPLVARF